MVHNTAHISTYSVLKLLKLIVYFPASNITENNWTDIHEIIRIGRDMAEKAIRDIRWCYGSLPR